MKDKYHSSLTSTVIELEHTALSLSKYKSYKFSQEFSTKLDQIFMGKKRSTILCWNLNHFGLWPMAQLQILKLTWPIHKFSGNTSGG